jgi:hypothetical protein
MQRHFSFLPAIIATAAIVAPAAAQTPRAAEPYAPVAITRPPAFDDASFVAFREALAAAAKSRVYAGLADLVRRQGFFWDRDFSHQFDPRKPSVDNLAAAISLEQDNGAGWNTLAAFAADATTEPLESRPGVICAPAQPDFDSVAFSKLLDVTYTSGIDWAYPRANETAVRTAPQPDAAEAGTLGAHFVRLLGFAGELGEPAPGRTHWAHVVLPDGKAGYVAPDSLMSLTAARLCYIKDPVGGWRITGVVAGGS